MPVARQSGITAITEDPVITEGRVESLSSVYGKYGCIYADPPWSYGDSKCGGGVGAQYATLDLQGICDLPVRELAHPDGCHLWMWTTWPMIRDGSPHRVVSAWGFRWVGEVVWFKGERLGVGRWLRPSTEVLILAERGKKKLLRYNQRGHLHKDKSRHSEKPGEFYKLIESLSSGPRIELFSRRSCKDWDRWGLQA
jgi:N6-adenosine-specific RNA methylase IME4